MSLTLDTPDLAPYSGGNAPLDVAAFRGLCESGWFGDRRVELIRGEIYVQMPDGALHIYALTLVYASLFHISGQEAFIVSQGSLWLSETTEVKPDCFVVRGNARTMTGPIRVSDVFLEVEVSDSSLRRDRHEKAMAYAEAGIPEYWIVNPVARQVEIYREPVDGEYQWLKVLHEGDGIAPLYRPDAEIAVDDLMPSPELSA
jgi:Uma2 family endonuclease